MKKSILILFGFLIPFYLFSQTKIRVIDTTTNEPLAMVSIDIFPQESFVETNQNGAVTVPSSFEKLVIYYPGFEEIEYQNKQQKSVIISLKANNIADEVVYKSKKKNKAWLLAQKVLKNKGVNEPYALKSYEFDAYLKFKSYAPYDSLQPLLTERKNQLKNKKTKDAKEDLTYVDFMESSDFFIGERVQKHYFKQRNKHKIITKANRISGLKNPLYNIALFETQNLSVYDRELKLMGFTYLNPFSLAGLQQYRFSIKDTIQKNNDTFIRLRFSPRKKQSEIKLFQGEVFVDASNYAITNWKSSPSGSKKVSFNQMFSKVDGFWFPNRQLFKAKMGETKTKIRKDSIAPNKTVIIDSVWKKVNIYFKNYTQFSNIKINSNIKDSIFKSYINEVKIDAFKKDNSFYKKYRDTIITTREAKTYTTVDSISKKYNAENYFKLLNTLKTGYFTMGSFDAQLFQLFNYNNHEGFRVQLGGKTNHYFSKKWIFGGHLAYGFKDEKIKYKLGTSYLINRARDGRIGVFYENDIYRIGDSPFRTLLKPLGSFYDFERFSNNEFYNTKNLTTYYQQDILPKINASVFYSNNSRTPLFDYAYKEASNHGTYKYNEIGLGITYVPNNKYVQTDYGKVTLKSNFPKLSIQITTSIGAKNKYVNYTRLDAQLEHKIKHYHILDKTHLFFKASVLSGDKHITHLITPLANSNGKTPLWYRFNLAGNHAFETMPVSTYYTDELLFWELKEDFLVPIASKFNLYPQLIYRGVWGQLKNKEYQFQKTPLTLENGYHEIGFQLNNLALKGLGLGIYSEIDSKGFNEESTSVKLTYKLRF